MDNVYSDDEIVKAVRILKQQSNDILEEVKKQQEVIKYNTQLLESILSLIDNRKSGHSEASKMVNNLSSIIGNNPAIKSNPDLANLINQMFDQLGSMKGEKP
jgi:hypothetical protein